MSDQIQKLSEIAQRLQLDAIALVPGPNFTSVVGREFVSLERPLVLVIHHTGACAAIVPQIELASWQHCNLDIPVFTWRDQDGYQQAFQDLAAHMPLQAIGVEGQVMRVFIRDAIAAAFGTLRIADAETEISALRINKTDAEVRAIKKAIDVSETALRNTLPGIVIGKTEKEIEALLIQSLFQAGADDLAFPVSVAAAENSALPHAKARESYALREGDPLLIDFGARCNGFCADITRTVFVGTPSDEGRAVYQAVFDANAAGHAATKPGASAHEIDDAVIGVLERSGFEDRIRSKTGHGIGREVHEHPYIMRGNRSQLAPGAIFTNEPGLYKTGRFGVRIEDMVLVTEDGSTCLTAFSKELTILGSSRV